MISRKPHILWVVPRLIHPPHSGGEKRIGGLMESLSERYRHSLISLVPEGCGEQYRGAARELEGRLVDRIYLADGPLRLIETLDLSLRGGGVDVVQLEFHEMGRYARFVRGRAKVVLTEHDAGVLSWRRPYARPSPGDFWGRPFTDAARGWLSAVRSARHCDRVVALSPRDARILGRAVPRSKIRVIPTGVRLEEFPFHGLEGRERGGVVFVGHYPHYPNEEAMVYFCREIWPLLRQEIPESRLSIVGSEPNSKIVSLESRAVRVVGTVPSVEPFLAKARLFVAPVRLGRGIKGKILEAFASGVPVVAMEQACEGMPELRDGEQLLIARGAEEFARASVRLLADDGLSAGLARRARAHVERHYGHGRPAELLGRLYEEVLRHGAA